MLCANVLYLARLIIVIGNIISLSVRNGEPAVGVCNYELSDFVY